MAAPLISAVIATRDRPELFERALMSVMVQDLDAMEIHVVLDGSSPENMARYDALFQRLFQDAPKPFFVHKLMHRDNGHGQSYSFNHGVSKAAGRFVTFLDDDDEWCDPQHLSRVAKAIETAPGGRSNATYAMTNQQAYTGTVLKKEPVWLEDLEPALRQAGRVPYVENFYAVSIDDLFLSTGFCHLNTSIISRDLYLSIGGMDEGVRWECDRDLFLRLIEAADARLFIPNIISKHYIPDPKDKSSMTTRASMVQKRLFQVQVLLKVLAKTRNDTIRAHCSASASYAMRKLALELKQEGNGKSGSAFAKSALALKFSPFWPVEYLGALAIGTRSLRLWSRLVRPSDDYISRRP